MDKNVEHKLETGISYWLIAIMSPSPFSWPSAEDSVEAKDPA